MKKKILFIIGKTVDGVLIVGGVNNFVETHGLPQDIVIDFLEKNGMVSADKRRKV